METKLGTSEIVELDYLDLKNGVDLTAKIERAYGTDGTGLLTVKNVPNYITARKRLLPLSREFSLLPDSIKEKYVHAESYYSFGWSHGKEKLQGKPDVSKGSYYANPQYDKPVDDEEIIEKYSSFVHPNIWPGEDLPEFEMAFKDLGQIIVSTGKLVARQCDKYVLSKCSSYPPNRLESIIDTSICCKARLLHYFPMDSSNSNGNTADNAEGKGSSESKDREFSSWCGWHNDHGSLTGLTAAMFLDADGNEVSNNDPTAGLYIRNRKSELIHVSIPVGNIAFQIGETAQVHSGGLLQATPHAVRGSKMPQMSRDTYAVFMEPNWDEPMTVPPGMDPTSAQSQSAAQNLPAGVPPLASRWHQALPTGASSSSPSPSTPAGAASESVIDFGQFSENTHKSYY